MGVEKDVFLLCKAGVDDAPSSGYRASTHGARATNRLASSAQRGVAARLEQHSHLVCRADQTGRAIRPRQLCGNEGARTLHKWISCNAVGNTRDSVTYTARVNGDEAIDKNPARDQRRIHACKCHLDYPDFVVCLC